MHVQTCYSPNSLSLTMGIVSIFVGLLVHHVSCPVPRGKRYTSGNTVCIYLYQTLQVALVTAMCAYIYMLNVSCMVAVCTCMHVVTMWCVDVYTPSSHTHVHICLLQPLLNSLRPVYCTTMEGVVVCFTGFKDKNKDNLVGGHLHVYTYSQFVYMCCKTL